MGFFTPDTSASFGPREYPEAGTYKARLYSVVDLGSSYDTYQGETRVRHSVNLTWELLGSSMSDGRPFVVGKQYSISNSRKGFGPYISNNSNLFKMLKSWCKGADEKKLGRVNFLGGLLSNQEPAVITIDVEERGEGKKRVVIEFIKAGKPDFPAAVNKPQAYEVGGPGLEELPNWMQKQITACLELNGGLPATDSQPEEQPELSVFGKQPVTAAPVHGMAAAKTVATFQSGYSGQVTKKEVFHSQPSGEVFPDDPFDCEIPF